MQKHIQLLGVVYIAYHAIGLIFAWLLWGVLSGIGMMSGDPQAAGIMTFIGTLIATLLFVLSAPGLIGGIGLLKGWWWSRYLVLVIGFLNLIQVPLGTILGIYTFWVLMQDESVAYFEADRV
jgi:hypothetical protein